MVRVEQWAEIRRLYFVKRLSIKEIARRTGRDRNTVRKAVRSSGLDCHAASSSSTRSVILEIVSFDTSAP